MTGFVNNLISAISRRARVRPAPTRLRPSTLQVESLEQRSLLTAIMPMGAPLPDSPAADDVVVDGRIITGENFDSANSSDQSIVRKITGRTNYQPAGASAFGGGAGHDVIFGGLGGEGDLQSASAGGHTGGVNVLFGDGSVRFVSDSIARSGPFQSEYKYVPVRRMPLYASGDADFRGRQIDYTGLEQTSSFSEFGGFTGGVYVAAGDVNGDGRDDIITGAGPGAPGGHVKVIDGTRLGDLGNDWLVGGTGRDNVAATTGRVNYFNGRFLTSPDLNAAGAEIDVLIFGTVGDENDDTASTTDNNHGTHVAGTIGAIGNNGPSQSSTPVGGPGSSIVRTLQGDRLDPVSDGREITTGSTKVVVAVIETGIDYRHTDLYSNIWIK